MEIKYSDHYLQILALTFCIIKMSGTIPRVTTKKYYKNNISFYFYFIVTIFLKMFKSCYNVYYIICNCSNQPRLPSS